VLTVKTALGFSLIRRTLNTYMMMINIDGYNSGLWYFLLEGVLLGNCWGEGKDATLRAKPSSPRYTNEGEMIGTVALRPLHCKMKARLRRSLLIPRVHLARRPTWNLAHCNGPRLDKRVTGLIYNSFSVMTVCNLPLWEYSGDNPGTRGHKRPCLGTLAARVPINTPVQCP
jgi:hypothetical protein